MDDEEPYTLYREDAKILAAIGEHVHAQVDRVPLRLPRALAQAAVDAWERDDEGDIGEETFAQYDLRGQAGDLALLGLVLSDDARWEEDEVVVDLHVSYAGAAFDAYVEAAGPSFRPREQAGPDGPDGNSPAA